ncbi:FKBP-type peptidyl-prolyl cis-trans isomerase [Methanomethylovorans hollandica DSM 15978]|uniref:Peptidyl-prolyl cis-trans isomerase n=1 Tax=Methanomethylovorans hollandica (strain DSM 15978 / NBRC 107637 / DMS1) TaxID=867904 RepID=L0KX47_METHD|nr:peptidylprolyl isomerase [Methanomethylovorans hollandica]AGB49260.1 FKBP-type peptidyl-prolyl cis-trans isomerase [Methanomethylovorans hollandica DSM 15978]
MAIKDGDTIKIDYTGTLDDGTVFDSSEDHGEPLEFTVGARQVIPGFEDAVRGMEVGEEKTFRIEASEAYGAHDPNLIQTFPRSALQSDTEIEVGMIIMLGTTDGQEMPAMITELTEETIIIDVNHPLAGQALTFSIKIIEA